MRNEGEHFWKKKILYTFSSSYPKSTPRIFQPPLNLLSLSLFTLYSLLFRNMSLKSSLRIPQILIGKDSFSITFQSFFFHSTTGFFCKRNPQNKKNIELKGMEAGSNCCSLHSIPFLLFPVFVFSFIFFHSLSFLLCFSCWKSRSEKEFSRPFLLFFL